MRSIKRRTKKKDFLFYYNYAKDWITANIKITIGAGSALVVVLALILILSGGGTEEVLPATYTLQTEDMPEAVAMNEEEPPLPTVTVEPEESEVARVQERLTELSFMDDDEPMTVFNAVIKEAIQKFQQKHDLEQTGELDEATKAKLFSSEAQKYMITIGDQGNDVNEVQMRLNELGYLKVVTDYYGTDTQAAVKRFQERNGLAVDGAVGDITKEMLYSESAKADAISMGTSGDDVLKLQNRLKELGYLTSTPDGKYGKDTVNAVKAFQQKTGLIADGHVGPATSTAIFSKEAQANAVVLGDNGTSVVNVQKQLISLKYMSGKADGYFGSGTEKAVKEFQKNNKLTADGKVGAMTMNVLLSKNAKSAAKSSGTSSGNSKKESSADSGGTLKEPDEGRVSALLSTAQSLLGTPYVKAGKSPAGFDCSGFVYWCLNSVGVPQGYMTSGSWAKTKKYPKIGSLSKARAGDILVFRGHVGIALGGGQMIDASSGSGQVRITNLNTPYWKRTYLRGFRVL